MGSKDFNRQELDESKKFSQIVHKRDYSLPINSLIIQGLDTGMKLAKEKVKDIQSMFRSILERQMKITFISTEESSPRLLPPTSLNLSWSLLVSISTREIRWEECRSASRDLALLLLNFILWPWITQEGEFSLPWKEVMT